MGTAVQRKSVAVKFQPLELRNFQDLLDELGGIPAFRVSLIPPPGQATEADVIAMEASHKQLYELVEGVLVEKGTGYAESMLTIAIGAYLREFVLSHKRGLITRSDGMYRLFPGLIRIPDVAYASWDRIPGRKVPSEPIPDLIPEPVVEVLSKSNTKREMERKKREYLESGVRLIWVVDPKRRDVVVIEADGSRIVLDVTKTLDGGDVLPGFTLNLKNLFAELDVEG